MVKKKTATTVVKYRAYNKMIGRDEADGKAIFEPVYLRHRVVNTCTKRYHNTLCVLAGITGCARDLIDRLTEIMGTDNRVSNTKDSRKLFIDFIARVTDGEVIYADNSVRVAFQKLAAKGILIPKGRSSFQVHPEYFFKEDDDSRIDQIKLTLEFLAEKTKVRVEKKVKQPTEE